MKKYILLLFLFLPLLVSADRGVGIWPPDPIIQTAQNVIVGWNGQDETMILSADTTTPESVNATMLRIIPFPSNPQIKEGNVESFKNLADIMAKKPMDKNADVNSAATLGGRGVEVIFQKVVGSHDLTVVKVDNLKIFLNWIKKFQSDKKLEAKVFSPEFEAGIDNYLKKDIRYFVFDVSETNKEAQTATPIIYQFKSDYLYYPMLISAISEIANSSPTLKLFLIMPKYNTLLGFNYKHFGFENYQLENKIITKDELKTVSSELSDLFTNNNDSEVRAISFIVPITLNKSKKDLMLYSANYWDTDLWLGMRNDKVKAMQKILINENDVWNSASSATGYFGKATEASVKKFQERYITDYLGARKYKTGTGIFGPITRSYFKKISLFNYQ